ncbi:MAG: ABC transporter permease [Anaerolineae bacterium]|nr:ABC transporter permease [Anaerolineae bacterium]
MIRTWRIFWHEYSGHLTRRSYLIFTFGFPLFMTLMPLLGGLLLAAAIQSAMPELDRRPIGVVDQVALFADASGLPSEPVEIMRYTDPTQAQAAFDRGEIQAIYDLGPDYWETGQIHLTYDDPPTTEIDAMVEGWVRLKVRAHAPGELLARLDQGASITHQDLSGSRTFSGENFIELALIFLPLYFVRLGSSFMAEYMFGSIASEANDRTMEILITSVSPLQLVVGKLLGLLAVGLTQLGTWAGAGLLLLAGVDLFFDLGLLTGLLGWEHLGLMLSVTLAAYIMDQVLAATLALFRVSGGAGSMLFNTVNWVVGLGLLYAIYFVPRNPDAPLAVIGSLVPVTASIILLIRVVVSEVPLWQIIAAQISLWGTIALSIFWLRWLLKANLVANATPFNLREWLRNRSTRLKKWKAGRLEGRKAG